MEEHATSVVLALNMADTVVGLHVTTLSEYGVVALSQYASSLIRL
jgi:hypothetical protein